MRLQPPGSPRVQSKWFGRGTTLPTRRLLVTFFFIFLILFSGLIASWPIIHRSEAFAASNPNAPISPPPWLHQSPAGKPNDLGHYGKISTTPITLNAHIWPITMPPMTISLTTQAQHVLSKDGQLEINIAAGSVSAAQLSSARGTIHLTITQVLPGSGGASSNNILFGSFQILLQDASGALLSNPFPGPSFDNKLSPATGSSHSALLGAESLWNVALWRCL